MFLRKRKAKTEKAKPEADAAIEYVPLDPEAKPAESKHAGEATADKDEGLEAVEPLKPAFPKKKAVTAVMAADDGYVPYLSALLQSIVDVADKKNRYDLVILTTDITPEHQAILKDQIEQKNVSLRFYDVTALASDRTKDIALRGHFQIETYYRLLMQEVFEDWDKVLYLDSDMIVLKDIAEVFDTDVKEHLLAACKDADTAGLYNGYEPGRKPYTDDVLKLEDPYGYFQAGTILFNLKMFRKTFDVDDMFEFASQRQWKLLDQDVLNVLAQGCIEYLPMEWNVMTDWRGLRIKEIISKAPEELYDEYMKARMHPAIVHYAGPEKPWDDPTVDMAWYFWDVARKTPFYEVLIENLVGKGRRRKPISDKAWEKLYPVYTKLLPDGSQRREVASSVYRKLVAGKKK